MAAVHSASTGSNNNDSKNSTHASTHRNGTASPGGWHFPKGGLGTPDLFYSFSGGSSSHGASHMNNAAGGPSGSSSQQQQPAWLKASTGTASPSVNSNSNTVNIAAPRAVSTSAAIKREEAGDNDDDDAKVGDAGDQSSFGGKFARDQEEGECNHVHLLSLSRFIAHHSPILASYLQSLDSLYPLRKILLLCPAVIGDFRS